MTKQKPKAGLTEPQKAGSLNNHMPIDKRAALRAKERMTLADHRDNVPYTNATTTGLYLGEELNYLGKHDRSCEI